MSQRTTAAHEADAGAAGSRRRASCWPRSVLPAELTCTRAGSTICTGTSSSSRNEIGDRVRAVASERTTKRTTRRATGRKAAQLLRPAPMSRCRGLPCGRTGAGALTTRYVQFRASRPVARVRAKQTSHQLTWKVNRPGGRCLLEAGWARERCGSRPSLSSRLGESTGQARRRGFGVPMARKDLCHFEFSASPPILWL